MKAMILAAGLGTRLRPLTDRVPKPLLPIDGRPVIEYTLRLLRRHGFSEVVINLHHRGHMISAALGDGSRWGLAIRYSEEADILGTGGGIKKAEPWLSGGDFLVINGDILVDLDLGAVVEVHRRSGAAATLVLREVPDADRWGRIGVDSGGRIRQILGRPPWTGGPLTGRMFTGIHVLQSNVFKNIPENGFSSIVEVYTDMLEKGEVLSAYGMTGFWTDIGTPDRYREAEEAVRSGRAGLEK